MHLLRNTLLLVLLALAGCIETDIVPDPAAEQQQPIVMITPADTSILVGQDLQYTAAYLNETGAAEQATFTWTSSDTAIAMIDVAGLVTMTGTGQATITAVATDGTEASALLTVAANNSEVAGFLVTVPTMINIYEQIQLQAVPVNVDGEPVAGASYNWVLADTTNARLLPGNILQGKRAGSVELTVVSGTIQSVVYAVEVLPSERIATIVPGPIQGEAARGTARLVRIPGDLLELRFDSNFRSDSGPSLFVYLSNCAIVNGSNQASCARVELGPLKSLSGAQTYAVPSNVTIDQYAHVIVLCKPFVVTFGTGKF